MLKQYHNMLQISIIDIQDNLRGFHGSHTKMIVTEKAAFIGNNNNFIS
jgi:hypothetical protein